MEIREVEEQDRECLLDMMEAFYHSEAVEKPIPRSYMEHTFDTAASGSPFIRLYLMEEDGGIVGYSLVGFTYSNEAGGQVLWIQELYLEEGYRGKGIGGSFLDRMAELFQEQVVQLRLELREDNEKARKLYSAKGFGKVLYEQLERRI
ncbi:GNAT family N-acetyltransferase [Cuneatibacter caecimuris]|uniref:Acetyltransferase (GNAT) family protein n=1 Tax=Cuneatibacter caecimuris TaxID=1796618 RepID=A0A4Q7PM77_9FIRM|nr:GNAT family N-acetyltransferase [Cuneatibacter caecimuris]RZT01972.1 acetyltransferase (GNAT) family protein [Cuneatibacter caecimuris]